MEDGIAQARDRHGPRVARAADRPGSPHQVGDEVEAVGPPRRDAEGEARGDLRRAIARCGEGAAGGVVAIDRCGQLAVLVADRAVEPPPVRVVCVEDLGVVPAAEGVGTDSWRLRHERRSQDRAEGLGVVAEQREPARLLQLAELDLGASSGARREGERRGIDLDVDGEPGVVEVDDLIGGHHVGASGEVIDAVRGSDGSCDLVGHVASTLIQPDEAAEELPDGGVDVEAQRIAQHLRHRVPVARVDGREGVGADQQRTAVDHELADAQVAESGATDHQVGLRGQRPGELPEEADRVGASPMDLVEHDARRSVAVDGLGQELGELVREVDRRQRGPGSIVQGDGDALGHLARAAAPGRRTDDDVSETRHREEGERPEPLGAPVAGGDVHDDQRDVAPTRQRVVRRRRLAPPEGDHGGRSYGPPRRFARPRATLGNRRWSGRVAYGVEPIDEEPAVPAAPEAPVADVGAEVVVYWRAGCPYCRSLFRQLDRRAIAHRRVDIHADPAAAALVRSIARGNETVPTVTVGPVSLVNPDVTDILDLAIEHAPHVVPEGYEPRQPGRLGRWVLRALGGTTPT